MATKNSSMGVAGILVFVGSLVYLYIAFTVGGLNGSWPAAAWLGGTAQLWTPFLAAFAYISAITLFFMGIGGLIMGYADKMMDILWKFITVGALSFFALTGGSGMFVWALLGFVLTYLGAASTKWQK